MSCLPLRYSASDRMAYPLSLSGVLPKSRVSRSAAWPGALFRPGRPEQSRQPRADTKTSEPQSEITTGSALAQSARRKPTEQADPVGLTTRSRACVKSGQAADISCLGPACPPPSPSASVTGNRSLPSLLPSHGAKTTVFETWLGRSDGRLLLPVTDADGDGGASS